MLIVKTFSYDPDQHPKVHEWCQKMSKSNFSDNMRNLIESHIESDLLSEIKKINHKLDNIHIANVFAESQQVEHKPVIEHKPIIKQAETVVYDDLPFNKNSLKNRYKL